MLQKYNILLFLILSNNLLIAQNFVYVNYSTQQGLANPVVYKALQDRDGFLWFATETGVSRFDGSRFVNYTTNEGLPSNEIINIFEDSKGRIWFLPFKNTICYYYKGKIYSPANDPILAKIKFKSNVWQVSEDKQGQIFLREHYYIHIIQPDGRVTTSKKFPFNISFAGINPQNQYEIYLYYFTDTLSFLKTNEVEGFITYEYKNGQFLQKNTNSYRIKSGFFYKISHISPDWYCYINFDTLLISNHKLKKTQKLKVPNFDFLSYSFIDQTTIFFNTREGSWEYNFESNKFVRKYLLDKNVCYTMKDIEGNLWFCTLGQGIYKLSTNNTFSLSYKEFNNYDPAVFSLVFIKNRIITGGNNGIFYEIKKIKTNPIITPHKILKNSQRISAIVSIDSNHLVINGDLEVFKIDTTFNIKKISETKDRAISAVKEIAVKDRNKILLATASKVYEYHLSNLNYSSTIFNERATCVAYHQDTTYIGTFKGLYIQIKDDSARFIGHLHPLLKERISKVVIRPNGQVWVATYDYGLLALQNLKPTQVLNEAKGLTSNFCRTMFIDNQILWVGTAKGLNRVDLSKPKPLITHFTYSTGLVSNIINAILVKDKMVYVGTPEGITYFPDNQPIDYSVCKLHLLDIQANNISKKFTKHLELSPQENNLKISFTAISYRSEGDITYYYRIKGLQGDWQTTRQNVLLFPSLPFGKYVFEIKARNKFGVESQLISVSILIQTPYWQTIWFYLLLAFIFGILTWQIARQLIARKTKREVQKLTLARKIAELEQTAVKAQMEPHFIFNCLASIQGLVLKNSSDLAYSYMNKFARLIRQTLEYSSKTFISIEEEVEYLSNYLALEQLQAGQGFQFKITVAENLDTEEEMIPVMLVQPYVENALKHAFKGNLISNPQINIHISKPETHLVCMIEDNGIGREKSQAFKEETHPNHQSKGMELVQKRIETLQLLYGNQITTLVEDKPEPHTGTLVKLTFA